MKPRIFVSSTFYDLKYIREELENFIKAHDFEPILFENGDVGYTPNMSLDQSCYRAISISDMAILIIGGNYGSAASDENEDKFKEFVSVTRKEFNTGVEQGIPFYVFIESAVKSEYEVYKLNREDIESGKFTIAFKACKNINVFRFIRDIESIGNFPVISFDKVGDIKEFLGKQWADMFKTYIQSLREKKAIDTLQDKVDKMQVLIEKMDKIVVAIGENAPQEIIKKQTENEKNIAEMKDACLLLGRKINLSGGTSSTEKRKDQVNALIQALLNMLEAWKKEPIDKSELINEFEAKINETGASMLRFSYSIFNYADMYIKLLSDNEKNNEMNKLLCSDEYYDKIFGKIRDLSELLM